MLLFKTKLFDHLCWFYTDGSVRGGLSWEDFCGIKLNIPTKEEQINDHLKLNGYTIGNENLISEFDPTYENSEYIKSMTLTKNGFSRYAKILTEDELKYLGTFAEEKIDEMIKNIDNANFKIEPKIKGIDNISCKFCKYQSICFKTEKDNKYIYPDEELKFLRGDENA